MISDQKQEIAGQAGAAVPADARSARGVRRGLVLMLSFLIACWFPNLIGSWKPISILLWGLVGDPNGFWDAARCVLFGGGVLAAYTGIVFMIVRLALKWMGVSVEGASSNTRKRRTTMSCS